MAHSTAQHGTAQHSCSSGASPRQNSSTVHRVSSRIAGTRSRCTPRCTPAKGRARACRGRGVASGGDDAPGGGDGACVSLLQAVHPYAATARRAWWRLEGRRSVRPPAPPRRHSRCRGATARPRRGAAGGRRARAAAPSRPAAEGQVRESKRESRRAQPWHAQPSSSDPLARGSASLAAPAAASRARRRAGSRTARPARRSPPAAEQRCATRGDPCTMLGYARLC